MPSSGDPSWSESSREFALDWDLGRDRSELIMSGAAILQTLLRIWPTESMRVADRGLREGMLFAMMSARGVFADGVRLE